MIDLKPIKLKQSKKRKLLNRIINKIRRICFKGINIFFKIINLFYPLNAFLEIRYHNYNKLSKQDKILIDKTFKKVYKRTIKEHILKWAEIDWIILGYINKKLVCLCYIVIPTEVYFDKVEMKVIGLGGVMTLPSYRRLGFTKKILEKANQVMFEKQDIDCALLICAKHLVELYNMFNWYELDCILNYNEGARRKKWNHSVMLKSNEKRYYPNSIEVNGKLW